MKLYIIAGEASGDLHAGNLIRQFKNIDSSIQFRGFGGDKMTEAGADITRHYREMAFMGVWEVLMNLKKIGANFDICKREILEYKPDALILVDYAGFNLRMAAYAKEHGIKTLFYISPKVWAWKKSRIKKIKAFVDRLYVILPFEKEFFKKHDMEVDYVGNPLTDAISEFRDSYTQTKNDFIKSNNLEEKPIIALLSGSRKQEIKHCLPEMIKASANYPEYQFVIAGAPSIPKEHYYPYLEGTNVKIVYNQTYPLLENAYAAIVTSGTATLETALFKVPQVVVYKTSAFTFIIARPFFMLEFFSLVNLIMDKEVVKEILQFSLAKNIKKELDLILFDASHFKNMLENYNELAVKVGNPGTSMRTAQLMHNYLMGKKV